MDRSCEDIEKRQIIGRIGKQAPNQIIDFWLLLDQDCSPGRCSNRWVHPSLKGHSSGEIQRIRGIHRYPVADCIEVESIAEFALAGPGCAVDGSGIAVA
jgi:hypothetical protein